MRLRKQIDILIAILFIIDAVLLATGVLQPVTLSVVLAYGLLAYFFLVRGLE